MRKTIRPSSAFIPAIESLESRRLLSSTLNGGLLSIVGDTGNNVISVSSNGSNQLVVRDGLATRKFPASAVSSIRIAGLAGDDRITIDALVKTSATIEGGAGDDEITGGGGDDQVNGNGGDDILRGGAGSDNLDGGAGNDHLYGGTGSDVLAGGGDDDVLVTIGGGTKDRARGNGGFDSFWTDADSTETTPDLSIAEILGGNVHRVGSFYGGVSKELNGQNLPDPIDSGSYLYNFSANPLFASTGPDADDVRQGYVGDCYFVATLSSVARIDPNRIRQHVVELGDGTYAVSYFRNGVEQFFREDADLPTWGDGPWTMYAGLGHEDSTWVAIMEKAFCNFRYGADTYGSINGGWMNEVYSALGSTSTDLWSVADGQSLLNYMAGELAAGKSVTFATLYPPADCPCIATHAYMVDHVNIDANGKVISVVVRNPWGYDGAGDDDNYWDGYVTLTANQALSAFWSVQSAYV